MSDRNKHLLTPEELADLLAPMEPEVDLHITIRAGKTTISPADLQSLAAGDIMEFSPPESDQLELYIDNRCIGCGRAVTNQGKPSIRLTAISLPPDLLPAPEK
jgi:flagellar motor switch/type III secretory pathway protein FliN